MPSCAVPTCKNFNKIKADGVTYHLFPTDERRTQWMKIIQRTRPEFWKPTNTSLICSSHFEEKYFYITKCGLRRLTRAALPTKNLIMGVEEPELCIETSLPQISIKNGMVIAAEEPEACIEINNIPQTSKEVNSPTPSDSLIDDVDVAHLDSKFNKNIENYSKQKLIMELRRKEMFCQKYIRKIKAMHQKNNRLNNKNQKLQMILRNLKTIMI